MAALTVQTSALNINPDSRKRHKYHINAVKLGIKRVKGRDANEKEGKVKRKGKAQRGGKEMKNVKLPVSAVVTKPLKCTINVHSS